MRKIRLFRTIGIILGLALLLGTEFGIWWLQPHPAQAEALQALRSDAGVTVSETVDFIAFMPASLPKAGLIFYPGGKVDANAYAAYMHAIAEQGYAAFIVKMPLNLAILGIDYGDKVLAAHPEIKLWAIGGHSLGGSMAARFAQTHLAIKGLLLWAAYSDVDLSSRRDLHVLSVRGSNDQLATQQKVDAGKSLLPPDAGFITIAGGNHAMFGNYGLQEGDGDLTIARPDAEKQVLAATLSFLASIAS